MTPGWTLITGAARGLGASICRRLVGAGHSVLIHYRTSRPDETVKACRGKEGHVESIQGDLSDRQGIESFIERLYSQYRLNALVNNVGIYEMGSLLTATVDSWFTTFFPNLFAPAWLSQAFVKQLEGRSGAIVNVGTAGLTGARMIRQAPLYTLSKWALWGFTRTLAQELASSNVRVNMISPGQLEGSRDLKPQGHLRAEDLPMRRAGTRAEVAEWVAFLLSPAAEYVTGQNIEISGGYAL